MKPSVLLISIVVFIATMAIFSTGYNAVLSFFNHPTPFGLLTIFLCLVLLIFCLGILGFFMYASDRRVGNIKTKIRLFEKLLGFAEDAQLPKKDKEKEVK